MATLSAFVVGLIFGVGLLVSSMADPAKVLGFLDLAGHWDPSLAFVMIGAIAVGMVAFAVAGQRSHTLLGTPLQLPAARTIDRRLVLGSAAFGIGWGLAGFCPGPALVGIGLLEPKALVFAAAMLVGMAGFEWLERRRASRMAIPTVASQR
jgi:uncharacterized membrane protein YedE/YeeE